MKAASRLALALARRLPRGYWRLARFAARRDPALWDLPLPLAALPGTAIRADLREGAYMNFLRHGRVPGTAGQDLFFRRAIAPGDTIFDVGANVGYTMLLFSAFAGPAGKVIALEPGRRAFAQLARNAEQAPNATALQLAASDHDGEALFHETELSDLSSLEPIAGALAFAVPTVRLDRLAETHGAPDFVKIDVEGHEGAVLRGMAALFGSQRPPIVLFEALDKARRDVQVAAVREMAGGDARLLRLGADGGLAADLDRPGSNDYLFLPAWAEARFGQEYRP